MGKRVGITTDTNERQKYWQSQYPNLSNFRIVKSGLTYEQAQAEENEYIKKGYEGSAGGEKKYGSVYSVYTFDY